MANRLDPIDIGSFVGGLNLKRNPLALADDESPDMCNVDVDPRGGFYTRKGWQRWNTEENAVDVETTTWQPRNTYAHTLSDTRQNLYVVNGNTVLVADGPSTNFVALDGVLPQAFTHGADMGAWGDDVYLVTGTGNASHRRRAGVVEHLKNPSVGAAPDTWSEVEAPVFNNMPQADFLEAHSGYMFVAATTEGGKYLTTRLRWSHPDTPDAWRQSDYIDIDSQGGRITGIMSFQDHLLIFKTNNVWALYGYDENSWQLVRVSTSLGCPCTTAASRSETMAFFFSASDKGGIYAYNGQAPMYITDRLRPAFEQIFSYDKVFVSWAGRRLWVSVPWHKEDGPQANPTSCFVFDPDTGDDGAWTMYRSDIAAIGPVIDGSDILGKYPIAALWCEVSAPVVVLDRIDDAYDDILGPEVLGTENDDAIVTDLDQLISIDGLAPIGTPFEAYYRTRWLHAGWPDRKKSWRRPTFICKQVSTDTELLVQAYRDYDETTIRRTRRLIVTSSGVVQWTPGGYDDIEDRAAGGFNWTPDGAADETGTGGDWAAATKGSQMVRGGSLGLARSVQMRVSPAPDSVRKPWGVDGIVAKIVMRRFR